MRRPPDNTAGPPGSKTTGTDAGTSPSKGGCMQILALRSKSQY